MEKGEEKATSQSDRELNLLQSRPLKSKIQYFNLAVVINIFGTCFLNVLIGCLSKWALSLCFSSNTTNIALLFSRGIVNAYWRQDEACSEL